MSPAGVPGGLTRLIPEPANLWIEASPRLPGRDDVAWVDLRSADLGGLGPVRGPGLRGRAEGLRLYLPPVATGEEGPALSAPPTEEAGARLHHVIAGEPVGDVPGEAVHDLLEILLSEAWERIETIPSDRVLVWPLIAGLTDLPEAIEEVTERIAERGPEAVVPLVVTLSGRSRRYLSERRGEEAFAALFHSAAADKRRLARSCAALGLDFLPPRRLGHLAASRRTAGAIVSTELALIADLWVDTGGSEARAQKYYRAARWFRDTDRDVAALYRESNLGILPWVDERIEEVVGELLADSGRATRLLRGLTARYAGLQ